MSSYLINISKREPFLFSGNYGGIDPKVFVSWINEWRYHSMMNDISESGSDTHVSLYGILN